MALARPIFERAGNEMTLRRVNKKGGGGYAL
jgi:hypothetical protein